MQLSSRWSEIAAFDFIYMPLNVQKDLKGKDLAKAACYGFSLEPLKCWWNGKIWSNLWFDSISKVSVGFSTPQEWSSFYQLTHPLPIGQLASWDFAPWVEYHAPTPSHKQKQTRWNVAPECQKEEGICSFYLTKKGEGDTELKKRHKITWDWTCQNS